MKKINLNCNTGSWLHLAEQLIEKPEYDKATIIFIIMAYVNLKAPPYNYLKRSVKRLNVVSLNEYAKANALRNRYVGFINKVLLWKVSKITEHNKKNLVDIPFSFTTVNGRRVMVVCDQKIKDWMRDNLSGWDKPLEIKSNIAAIGVENNKPIYYEYDRDGELSIINHLAHTPKPTPATTTHESNSVTYKGRMKKATPVWVAGKPKVSGVYVCASVSDSRDFIFRGRVPDECTEIEGKLSTRVGENLYIFDADTPKGKVPWQSVNGFYDGGITHYLDFEVSYE